jgi:Dyp-type peroxidase family
MNTPDLDLADIQGNILTAYGRLGFPKARFLLFTVQDAAAGRHFVEALRPRITSALRWRSHKPDRPTGPIEVPRPDVAINIAFTFRGLLALEVPTRTLRGMPDDFIDGMAARSIILGDDVEGNRREAWDPVWTMPGSPDYPHILVTLNAQMAADGEPVSALEEATRTLIDLAEASGGKVLLCEGHRGADRRWQDLSAITERSADGSLRPVPTEHFGFVDAISDPAFEGQVPPGQAALRCVGQGKSDGHDRWSPLATGEFLLGWPDEAQEIPGAAMPLSFSRNGTFMAYRKLHQNVSAFEQWITDTAAQFQRVWNLPDRIQAEETLRAKIAGRWRDGVPLITAPDFASWEQFNRDYPEPTDGSVNAARQRLLVAFGYRDDPKGRRCPVGAHARRMSTRDMLDPHASDPNPKNRAGSALNNRRRILRRGLPYGDVHDPNREHGIVMMAMCASLSRQFEFVQQQWLNYGLDFGLGNDTCPLVGNHGADARFVIAAEPGATHPPFIATNIPQFVSARGGDYFFVPSLTALRMIAMGLVDPT